MCHGLVFFFLHYYYRHHHHQQTPQQPQEEAGLEQLILMKEMKSYLNSIQDGIRMIAANTVVNNAELSGQTPQVNNPTEVEVDTHESIISNPDHIELVSVDIVNEDNDSIASADDQVHEIHTATEGAPRHMHNLN